MILKVILLFCVIFVAAGRHVNTISSTLIWPSTYSIEARKYYMSSGLIENFKYWRTVSNSRLEANDGAVIKIAIGNTSDKGIYEIHPETTEEETNKIVCDKYKPRTVNPETFLPAVEDLNEEGTENVRGIDCVKFTNNGKPRPDFEKTLWAYYHNGTESWVPVRYKTKQVDEWHGYLNNYEMWDYFNFNDNIDSDVFKVTYDCEGGQGFRNFNDKIAKNKKPRSDKPRKLEKIPFPYSEKEIKKVAATLPKEYDLRVEGLVGPVMDRLGEDCESAWAFAVTAAVEGALARSNGGTWMKLSEQALIDCSWGYGNEGCNGGILNTSYSWIMEHGLPLEQKYGAYTNQNGLCKMENMTKTFNIKGYTDVVPNSIDALKIALINHGPVSVNVIESMGIRHYDEGVIYDESCDYLMKRGTKYRTPMTLIGYGEKDGDTFWILKESKGPYWGVDGYIYLSARNNNCGVMNEASYAVA